jgi:hypothetical protein
MDSEEISAHFSRADYILLLDVVGTALDRLTAVADSLNPEAKEFVDAAVSLEQRLLSFGTGAGFTKDGALVGTDPETGEWVPQSDVTAQFLAHEIVELRDEDFFWDELAQRMAEQTAMRRMGAERWDDIGEKERRTLTEGEFDAIADHLTEHGLGRLFFIDHDPHG